MICRKCGEILPDYAFRCSVCGAAVKREENNKNLRLNPTHNHQDSCAHEESNRNTELRRYSGSGRRSAAPENGSGPVGFIEAIRRFFINALNFRGRATRSEFWWAYLALCLFSGVIGSAGLELAQLGILLVAIPTVSLCVRRLHDAGKSGWWYFVLFIPGVGVILLLLTLCAPSQGRNQWGPGPER